MRRPAFGTGVAIVWLVAGCGTSDNPALRDPAPDAAHGADGATDADGATRADGATDAASARDAAPPADARPADAQPADAQPADAQPADARPADLGPDAAPVACAEHAQCAPGEACADGMCRRIVCEPGATGCADDTRRTACDDTGTRLATTPCAAGEFCEAGACRPRACEPGRRACDGDAVVTCDARGAVASVEPCAAACDSPFGCACVAGACLPRACAPGSARCAAGGLEVCDGLSFGPPAPCPAGTRCVEDRCRPDACAPGAAECAGDVLLTCAADGSERLPRDCAAEDLLCEGGACVPRRCAPGAVRCDAAAAGLLVCDARGAEEQTFPCPAGTFCDGVACVPWVCPPDAPLACHDGDVHRCDGGRALVFERDCGARRCDGGECVPTCGDRALDPGETCDDGNDRDCDGCERCEARHSLAFWGGAGRYAEVADAAGAPLKLLDTDFTVETWMQLTDTRDVVRLVRRDAENHGWGLSLDEDGILATVYGGFDHAIPIALAGTGWHHVAWTYDRRVSRVFLNGGLVGESARDAPVLDAAAPLIFGALPRGGQFDAFHSGRMDEIRVSRGVRYLESFLPPRRVAADADTVGLWHFDEGQGDRAADASGNAQTATLRGLEWEGDFGYGYFCQGRCARGECVNRCGDRNRAPWEACDDGNLDVCDGCEYCQRLSRLELDGTTDHHVRVEDGPGSGLRLWSGAFTVELWARMDERQDQGVGLHRRCPGDAGWSLLVVNGGLRSVAYGVVEHRADAAVVGNGWHHVAWTYDGADSRLYLDGHLVGTRAMASPAIQCDVPLHIGVIRDPGTGALAAQRGGLDEVRVSRGVRYAADFVPPRRHVPDATTIALWHFDEPNGAAVADDASGSHLRGTVVGRPYAPDDGYGRFCGR